MLRLEEDPTLRRVFGTKAVEENAATDVVIIAMEKRNFMLLI